MDCAIKVDGKSVPAADRLKLLGATPSTCSFTSGPIAAVSAPECAPDPAASQADSAALGTRGTTALRCSVWIRPWSAGARGRHLAPGDATIPRGTPPEGDAGGDPYITGCPLFTPAHAVMAEVGLMPVPAGRPARRAGQDYRGRWAAQPTEVDDGLAWGGARNLASGWDRPAARPRWLHASAPPWEVAAFPDFTFRLDIGTLQRDASADELHLAAQRHLATLPSKPSGYELTHRRKRESAAEKPSWSVHGCGK